MTDDLKPCPFCGKPGSIDEERSRANPDRVVFIPSCSDSECICILVGRGFARRVEAIAAWNDRSTALPEGEVSELVKRLRLQKLSSELDAEARDDADWEGGYDGMVELAREAASMLTLLQSQVDVARKMALNEAVKICDELAGEYGNDPVVLGKASRAILSAIMGRGEPLKEEER